MIDAVQKPALFRTDNPDALPGNIKRKTVIFQTSHRRLQTFRNVGGGTQDRTDRNHAVRRFFRHGNFHGGNPLNITGKLFCGKLFRLPRIRGEKKRRPGFSVFHKFQRFRRKASRRRGKQKENEHSASQIHFL